MPKNAYKVSNKLIFKVKGYKLYGRSPGSFKLDLRNACKRTPLYLVPVNKYVESVGILTFGTPAWKGLFEMRYEEEGDTANIRVYLDHRISMFEEYEDDIKAMIEKGLQELKKRKIIEDFKEV